MHQFSGSLDILTTTETKEKKNLHRRYLRKPKSMIKHHLDSFILRNLYLTQTKIPFPFKIRHSSQNIHYRNTCTVSKCIRYKKATKSCFKCDKGWLSLRNTTDTTLPHFPSLGGGGISKAESACPSRGLAIRPWNNQFPLPQMKKRKYYE